MHISSTVRSQKLLTASVAEPDQEGSSTGCVKSVEPEAKLVGAECIKGIYCTSDVERDVVEVAPAESELTLFNKKTERIKLYGVYSTTPLTMENLEDITRRIRIVEENASDWHARLKLAGLKVQEFIIRMVLGQYDENTLSEIYKCINSISQELYPDQINSQSDEAIEEKRWLTELWPIDQDFAASVKQGMTRRKRKLIDGMEDKAQVLSEKEIDRAEKKMGALLQDISRYIDILTAEDGVLSVPRYSDRVMIRNLKMLYPDIYARAVQHNIVKVLDDNIEPTRVDQCLLVLYCLPAKCIPDDIYNDSFRTGGIDALFVYRDQIRRELERGDISRFDAQQLAVVWLYCLSTLSHTCLDCFRAGESLKMKRSALTQSNKYVLVSYIRKCLDLIKWAETNGFLEVAPFGVIQQLLKYVILQGVEHTQNVRTLAFGLVLYEIKTATKCQQLRHAYNEFVYMHELLSNEDDFNRAMVVASQYTLLPVFIRMWHDLGVAGRSYRWNSESIKPECAIEFLIKLRRQPEKLQEIKVTMDDAAEYIMSRSNAQTCHTIEFAPRVALYYYLTGRKEEGEAILQYGNVQCYSFFQFLSLIAEERFETAIEFMEKALQENDKHRVRANSKKSIRDLHRIKPRVLSLISLLHKKIAENKTHTEAERRRHLELALGYLMGQVKIRGELYLSVAEIQEKLGRFQGALDSYDKLEKIFEKYSPASYENCQLRGIRQAKERLADIIRDLPEAESGGYEDSSRDITQEKFRKPKKAKRGNKRSCGKPAAKPVKKLSFDARETVLSSTPIPAEQISETDTRDKALAACVEVLAIKEDGVQGAGDKGIEPGVDVIDEGAMFRTEMIDGLTEKVVEMKMRESRCERHELCCELLFSADIDYDGLLVRHEHFYKETDNIVLKLLILQNKMWTLRHKTFDTYILNYEANQRGIPVARIKIDLRLEILNTLLSNIESLRTLWTTSALPDNWKTDPEVIVRSADFQRFWKNKTIAGRFWVQFGAQFSTMAHVMQDIHLDQLQEEEILQYHAGFFGENPGDFGKLYHLFYKCRDCIDPGHRSRTC